MPDQPQARPGPPLRVLVADDNPVVRAGLTALLDTHPDIEVVAQATNGEEAVDEARRHHPDVALLDVRMPGTDGLTALPELTALCPVMMLTYSTEPEVVAEALRRGAVGYLVHGDFTAPELIAAVRNMREGHRTISATVSPVVSSSLGVSYKPSHESHDHPSQLQPFMAQSSKERPAHASALHRRVLNRSSRPSFGLSSREVEVMDLIASGMNNRQIAATCFISEKTVKNHINRIFAKLHSSTRSEAIAHWLGTTPGGWPR
ncbi:response regulator [Streptomyces sp. NPDC057474]|uniref:response regulator n=1 Tax=Streptomyces sp. NPDC057474 TaxID=3346144 RepID=UPI0036AF232D